MHVSFKINSNVFFCVTFCCVLLEPYQRKRQAIFAGQAAVQIEGDRPQGSYLLTDGSYAGHLSRVSPTAPFPLSGKYLYRASFHWVLT